MRERFTRSLQWLLPGVGVKRWIFVAAFGIIVLLDAATRWLTAQGTGIHVNEILDGIVDDYFPPAYLTWILGVVGIALVAAGIWMWIRAVVRVARGRSPKGFRDALAGRRLQQGYKIVAIGGGTGLSTLLRGLKRRTSNLTAIVTVSDDGGSSGRLQRSSASCRRATFATVSWRWPTTKRW